MGAFTLASERRVQPAPWAPGVPLAPSALQQSLSALARLDGDMGVPAVPEASSPRWGTLLLAIFLAASRGLVAAFKVTTPYSLYVCPEGQNATLTCRILGPVSKGHDVTIYKTWYLSSRGEVQMCKEHRPIRNFTLQHLQHLATLPGERHKM